MKRLAVLLVLCLLLAGFFCLPVCAETAATQVDLHAPSLPRVTAL